METTKTPITGKENIEDTESAQLKALISFYKAFNNADIERLAEVWLDTAEVSMDNPIGGIRRGWADVSEGYKKLFGSKTKVQVEFWDYTLHTTDNMFVAVGRERGTYGTEGNFHDLQIRTTRIFTKIEGKWRLTHHHGSIDDARLLEDYQGAF